MILVVNKGRSTHIIEIVDFGRRIVKTSWWDENEQDHVECLDEVLWYEVAKRDNPKNVIQGKPVGGAVYLSKWDWVYILMPDLVNQRPLSNANWIKRPE